MEDDTSSNEDNNSSNAESNNSESTEEKPNETNLIVYSMATNEPALKFKTSSVPLSLGIAADLGKLYLSATDVLCDDWHVSMYIDSHPKHRIVRLYRQTTKKIDTNEEEDNTQEDSIGHTTKTKTQIESEVLPDIYESVRDRVREFIKESYVYRNADNVLVIQGHGNPQIVSQFTSIGVLSDGSLDNLKIVSLAKDISMLKNNTDKKPFKIIALDSCCLALLENVVALEEVCDYVVAFQDEAPWNGFVNAYLLEILCSNDSWPSKLKRVLQIYAQDAESQDKPSSISLFATEHSKELLELVRAIRPMSPNPSIRDLWSDVFRKVPSHAQTRFRNLFNRVLLAHEIPSNAPRRKESRHGMSILV